MWVLDGNGFTIGLPRSLGQVRCPLSDASAMSARSGTDGCRGSGQFPSNSRNRSSNIFKGQRSNIRRLQQSMHAFETDGVHIFDAKPTREAHSFNAMSVKNFTDIPAQD